MKLPWSSKKNPYTRHSAPITNGILRNGKGSGGSGNSNCSRQSNGEQRVTFALRRTGSSQIPLNALRATCCDSAESERRPGYGSDADRRRIESADRLSKDDHLRRRRRDAEKRAESRKETISRDRPPRGSGEDRLAAAPKPNRRERRRDYTDMESSTLSREQGGESDHSTALEKHMHKYSPNRSGQARKERRGSSNIASSITSRSSLDSDKQRQSTSSRKERRSSTITSESSLDSHKQRRSAKANRRRERPDAASSKVSSTSEASVGSSSSNKPGKSESTYSEESCDTIASLPQRLGDMPPEKLASSYGKWESNGTLDTADTSDFSERSERPPRGGRTRLSLLLDEKIEAKMRREAGI